MSAAHPVRAVARSIPLALALLVAAPVTTLLARQAAAAVRAARTDVQVSGTITDAATGRAIEGAQVFAQGTGIGAVSDSGGRYRLIVPRVAQGTTLVIVARRIGYASVQR